MNKPLESMARRLSGWLPRLLVLALFASQPGLALETVTYFHNDVAGTPLVATDAAGAVVWKESYRPYGERLVKAPASDDNRVWYTGKPHDESTGLSYFGARYYDPVLGRFMGVDPKEVEAGDIYSFNRYAYGNNNPHRFIDPDGRDAVGIAYDGYQVDTGYGFRLPLGHGGVLLIDENSGHTEYYEYGRYNPDGKGVTGEKLPTADGNVRTVAEVPQAVIGNDGMPTKESLATIYAFLSKNAGKGNPVEASYHEDADFAATKKYIGDVANNRQREKYSITGNNCKTFRDDAITAGEKR